MATSWKSQQGNGEYALQFETDDKRKYKLVEKAAQMAVDGKVVARYIDIENVTIPKGFFEDLNVPKLLAWLASQPTADVASVCHCPDCIYCEMGSTGFHLCKRFGGHVTDNDYCSRFTRTPKERGGEK